MPSLAAASGCRRRPCTNGSSGCAPPGAFAVRWRCWTAPPPASLSWPSCMSTLPGAARAAPSGLYPNCPSWKRSTRWPATPAPCSRCAAPAAGRWRACSRGSTPCRASRPHAATWCSPPIWNARPRRASPRHWKSRPWTKLRAESGLKQEALVQTIHRRAILQRHAWRDIVGLEAEPRVVGQSVDVVCPYRGVDAANAGICRLLKRRLEQRDTHPRRPRRRTGEGGNIGPVLGQLRLVHQGLEPQHPACVILGHATSQAVLTGNEPLSDLGIAQVPLDGRGSARGNDGVEYRPHGRGIRCSCLAHRQGCRHFFTHIPSPVLRHPPVPPHARAACAFSPPPSGIRKARRRYVPPDGRAPPTPRCWSHRPLPRRVPPWANRCEP